MKNLQVHLQEHTHIHKNLQQLSSVQENNIPTSSVSLTSDTCKDIVSKSSDYKKKSGIPDWLVFQYSVSVQVDFCFQRK